MPNASSRNRRARSVSSSPLGYQGGEYSSADPDFSPALTGPNALADRTLPLLRRRCRWLVDQHPNLSGAVQILANNVVGTGYFPKPNTGDVELDKKLTDLWWEHAEAVDVDRRMSMAQSQELALREMAAVGEFLVDIPYAPAWRGVPSCPALDLIDTDRLPIGGFDMAISAVKAPSAGSRGEVRQGVELDSIGRVTGYHLYEDHPADGGFGRFATRLIRLDASRASLGFVVRRVRQRRGIPWPVAVVNTTRMEDAYHEANILMAQSAAYLGLFFKGMRPPGMQASDEFNTPLDGAGNPVTSAYPGQVGYLAQNADLIVKGGSLPGPTFDKTLGVMQQRMAAGLGISYAALSRDNSKNNFASQRAEALEDRRGYRRMQSLLWHLHTRPYWEALTVWAVTSGKINLDKVKAEVRAAIEADPRVLARCSVVFSGWEWVNPAQEASADETALRIGKTSRQRIAQTSGATWQDIIDEELEVEKYEIEKRKSLGLPPKQIPAGAAAPPTVPPTPAAPAPDNSEDAPDNDDSEDSPSEGDPTDNPSGDPADA